MSPASGPADEGRDREATLQLMIALGRAYRALERGVRPHLAERGLGLSEFAVLEVLHHQGPLTLSEIRDRILVTGASTTYVVNKLEERGLVRRVIGTDDQRTVIGELTQKGRALIADVFPRHVEQLHRLMSGLSVADKHAAASLLRSLAAGASAHQ
jgi:MarR family transcriptional regulator, 2-MHQ and catechol-resistance regulon repressor